MLIPSNEYSCEQNCTMVMDLASKIDDVILNQMWRQLTRPGDRCQERTGRIWQGSQRALWKLISKISILVDLAEGSN